MSDNYRASAALALGIVALDALSLGLVLPVLPKLVAQVSHASDSQTSLYVGALFSIYALMQFLCSPVVGGLSDRFGRRPVLLISLLCLGLNALLWVWVGSIGWLFALRVSSGLFASNVPTASAYIADITPPEKRAQYFGLIGAMFGIGFILGPVVGGILGQIWIRLPFLVAACLIGCNVLYGFFMLRESLPHEKRRAFQWRRANPFGSLQAIGLSQAQKRLIFVWCCLWLTVGAHQASFVLSNQMRFGWSILQNGLVLGFGGIFQAIVMALFVSKAIKRWGERRTALLGMAFCMIAYLLFSLAMNPWILFVGVLALAPSMLAMPTIQAMLSVEAGEERQGEVQGALSSLQGLMLVIGPLMMGAVFSFATRPGQAFHFPGAPFLAAAVIALIALVVLRGLHRPHAVAGVADLPAQSFGAEKAAS